MTGRFPIEEITPSVACGRYPAKAVVGELVPVSARAYREGHRALGCNVVWSGPDGEARPFTRMRPGWDDHWHATITPDAVGDWTFAIEAFDDPYLTWRDAVTKKTAAGQDAAELGNDLAEGAALMEAASALVPADSRATVRAAAAALRDPELPLDQRLHPALDLAELLWAYPVRRLVTRSDDHPLWTDRPRALFSAWYEFFPRSEGVAPPGEGKPAEHGTFATATARLPGVAAMGFDVLYLPPIHPIGRVNRKGPNNSLAAGPDDVGSPWAIGAAEGGHDAIHPALGTAEDFRRFVGAAGELGLEVAMDLALQAAPDHPWVTEHPEWFTTLADGSIAYAENPPKKYQDIYPLDFDRDPEGIRAEVLRVVTHWISQGVRIFRVDNPHTKPFDFWHWLIGEVKRLDPDVLFLAEAFTRPSVMHGLGRIGFTQSYTYFSWRYSADELREYCTELVNAADYMRPNFWPNTPDILPEPLKLGVPSIFKIRAVLASLLSPPGASTPASNCSNTRPCPAPRSTPTARSSSCAPGTGPPPRRRAARWRRTSPGSTPYGGRTRRCTGCATCGSTTATTRHCSAGPSGTSAPATPSWWSARSTRSTSSGATSASTCRHSAWTGPTGSPSTTS